MDSQDWVIDKVREIFVSWLDNKPTGCWNFGNKFWRLGINIGQIVALGGQYWSDCGVWVSELVKLWRLGINIGEAVALWGQYSQDLPVLNKVQSMVFAFWRALGTLAELKQLVEQHLRVFGRPRRTAQVNPFHYQICSYFDS